MRGKLLHIIAVVVLVWASSCSEEAEPPPPPPNPVPGQPIPGQPIPGQPIPGQPIPGQPIPGQPIPGQPIPGQPIPGQPIPGQPIPGQPIPGQPIPGQPIPGQPIPGQPIPGQTVAVTLTANSTPAGATVLRANGEVLGTTPLVSQIQLPAAQVGLPQTFTFNLTGYQPAVAQAVAVNNAITVQATLQPVAGATPGVVPGVPGMPRTLNVSGRGGGRITDFRTTTSSATVSESCVIQNLRVRIQGRHSYHGDLIVRLSGPNGQSATLHNKRSNNPFRAYTVNRAVGTQAMGTWRLSIRDDLAQDSGALNGFSMTLTCQ